MALVVANRVQETTTTAGTGTITLAGASAGYQSFAVIGNGNTTYYTIVDGNNWEVGIGTYTASGTTLSRDTVLSSSAAGAKINLSGNTARVFVDYPAEKAISDGYGTLPATNGGTGQTSYAVGDLLYASSTTALSKLADVATGNALISGGVSTAPAWGKIGLTTHVSGTLPVANGGTNATATPTAGAVAYGTGTAYAFTSAGTSGQVLTSNGASAPTWGSAPAGIAVNPRTLLTTKTISYGVTPTRFTGSVNLSATTQMIFVTDGTSYYASVYDSSTDTMGSPVTVASAGPSGKGGLGIVKLSSTSVLIGYASTSSEFTARVLSVSGTTLTANTTATVAATCSFVSGDPVTLGSTYVFSMFYIAGTACNLIAATVSGTTVTLGTASTVSASSNTSYAYLPVVAYSSTTGFAMFVNSGTFAVNYRGFSVSGTTITLGTTSTAGPAGVPINTIAYHTLSNDKVICIFFDNSSFLFSLVSLSGTTPTVSASSPGTFNSNATAAMYSVVDGTSVLLVASGGANSGGSCSACVIRDNAGTIAVSAVTSIGTTGPWNLVPASSTTIMASSGVTSVPVASIVSVVSNAPSVATTTNTITGSGAFASNNPLSTSYISIGPNSSSGAIPWSLTLFNGFYTNSVLGTSGNYYKLSNNTISYAANPTTKASPLYAPNYIAANSVIDTTITGGSWYASFDSTTTLYRVQYA